MAHGENTVLTWTATGLNSGFGVQLKHKCNIPCSMTAHTT